jgi:phospholipid/cholesterol/gamma-HCH transport system substrate-binding protein
MRRFVVWGAVAAVVIAAAVYFLVGNSYTVQVALPEATNMVEGGTLQLNGFEAGSIGKIEAVDNQALVQLHIDSDFAPLHDGAVVTVPWKALLGERVVNITDGPKSNAAIPNHGMIPGKMAAPTELDMVLNALDKPTLDHLRSLVNQLNNTSRGHETEMNATLLAAGPTVEALGGVLDAIGTNGPAIRGLVVHVNSLVGTFARHQQDVRQVVTQLDRLTELAAQREQKLRVALHDLPPVLHETQGTLDRIPPVAAKAIPLLHDLEPASRRLIPFGHYLKPVLRDLRPTVRDLRPTLQALADLLRREYAPRLLDDSYEMFPQLTHALHNLSDPLDFLRPYTPEAMGWISNWNSAFSAYDGNGHFARIWPNQGPMTPVVNPGVIPPGVRLNPFPLPGENGNSPWKDAFGSSVR